MKKVPLSFKPFLWSYDFDKLDLEKNKQTIIMQILYFGNIKQWRELFHIYGYDQVKNIFKNSRPDEWQYKAINFWKLKFDLK